MGGKPSRQTPADMRLKENKGKPPASGNFGGKKAPPFKSKSK